VKRKQGGGKKKRESKKKTRRKEERGKREERVKKNIERTSIRLRLGKQKNEENERGSSQSILHCQAGVHKI
jgi:hypothetical protein